jgi:hypothetical protein
VLYFKACPKCKTGTVQLDSDFYGSFITCLNCGFEKSAASVRKINFDQQRVEADAAISAEQKAPVAVAAEADDDDDLEDDYYDEDEDDLVELERAVG